MNDRICGSANSIARNLGFIGLMIMPKCPACFVTWLGILGLIGIPTSFVVSSFSYLFCFLVTIVLLSQLFHMVYFRRFQIPLFVMAGLAFVVIAKSWIPGAFWFFMAFPIAYLAYRYRALSGRKSK